MNQLPYSQACENNKAPILAVLQSVFGASRKVLEIASGTGQHATWFAEHLAHLQWQPTELPENLSVVQARVRSYQGENLLPEFALDVSQYPWPVTAVPDAIFTANSLHIMPWESVEALFTELGARSAAGTVLAIYGPFNYSGRYTSPSNAEFDTWLKQKYGHSAIRDFERVDQLAFAAGFGLQHDYEMPANNRLLIWHRK